MRVAVAGLAHESNTFSSQPTRLQDFGIREGTDLLEVHNDTYHEIAGYIAAARELDMELCPTLSASATPAGAVTSTAYEEITGRILEGIGAQILAK